MISAVVLAAGSASRFGATKQLERVGGVPLVRCAVRAAREAGIEEVVVVVGHDAEAVAEAAGDARVVVNERFAQGQSTSLLAGLRALGPDVGAAVILLADQPGVTGELVRALLEAAEGRPEPIVRLRFLDAPGPALLHRSAWVELEHLEGDAGARELIERRPDLVFEATMNRPAPLDVDTRTDLERAREELEQAERAEPASDTEREEPPSF